MKVYFPNKKLQKLYETGSSDMAKKIKPFINIGPGQIIKRNLEALNWSQEDLSEIIGMSPKSISLLINNKQSITVETAFLLAIAFKTSPEFWLNLDQNYRLRLKEEGRKERETATKAEIRKYMPLLEMKRKGWIHFDKTAESQAKAFCDFWKQETLGFSMYSADNLPYCTRQGKSDEQYTKYYTSTWLQKARQTAKEMKSYAYSKKALQELSDKIPAAGLQENGVEQFIKALEQAGVKFFVLSHLSKTYLDGASFYDGKNPVAVYTGRYNRLDNFWFTMAHEIAHILLHLDDKTECFIDNLDEKNAGNPKEVEADKRACEILHVDALLKSAEPYKGYFTETRLLKISDTMGIQPSVALGILQHYGVLDYRTLNRYKSPVLDKIPKEFVAG